MRTHYDEREKWGGGFNNHPVCYKVLRIIGACLDDVGRSKGHSEGDTTSEKKNIYTI